ncbi:TAF6-like RNA polymerase II p300/CBP-associated factor-associated factor 65 kDa subunit 6L [Amphibalanus amphitrite]|uniref:TAF6-like RNA polymerase II p300/CBP-associated factor-associated factor 65 kDa subunit 6L n=1 Tax=Amphibalanus amphitrite TaxID=1232801 RepID=UPI001C9006C1|nr:TAF6-like RNA polymerase II p300/CBP-associated factor-associated factor 65 kDa subunit 6L [Amphibalanus amphitrite]XP_043231791.1 TAF6-like RNA polymerase II p300/CBP-associated factor-associated factor 65 kDa subunit 6L [Amphibalanus amphitrite]
MSGEGREDGSVKKEPDTDPDTGYAILTDEFIRTAFESLDGSNPGVSGLTQEAADALNQDVCYRIRELTHSAARLMRHSGRRRLTHSDMTRALRWYGAPPVLGHSTRRPLALLPLSDAGLWVAEQRDCDLAQLALSADPPPPAPPAEPPLSVRWLVVEGRNPDVKPDPDRPVGGLNAVELDYYEQTTRALFGSNLELLQMALHDLETSGRLAPLLPHLLRCLLQAIRHLTARPAWLHRLLRALQALTRNTSLNLGCKPNLNHIASALVFCAIEGQQKAPDPLVDAICVKEFSARLLAQLVHKWTTPVNQLPEQIARTLHDVVQDRRRILRQQYGAITALTYMGPEAILRYLCPLLPQYVPAMQEVLSAPQLDLPTRMDAMRVQAALALAIQHYLRHKALEFADDPDSAGPGPPPLFIYQLWADLCDGLAAAPPPASCVATLAARRPPPPPPAPVGGCAGLWPPGSRRPRGAWLQLVRVPPARRRPLPPRAAVFQGAPLRQRFPTIYFSFIGASPLPEHLLRRVQFPRSHPIASQASRDARPRRGGLRRWPAGGTHVHRSGRLDTFL